MKKLGVGLLAIFLAVGCTKKEAKTEYDLPVADTLRINIMQEPPSLDWSIGTDTTSALITYNLMEGLVEYNVTDPELGLIPALATSWTSNKNATKWTFKLRKDVKWTDGIAFTGQDVLNAWERLLNPATAAQYAYFLYPVKNAKAYNEKKIMDFSQVGAKLNADGDLEIELEQPTGYFPMLMAHHSTYPMRTDIVKKHGVKWTDPANIVTLGAYKLSRWDHDKALVMERNDNYYGDKAKTKYVLAYMINEQSTAINLFDSGKLDFHYSLPSRELRQLKTRKEYRETPSLVMYYYGFNVKEKPFDDVRVRRAFVQAVNRKEITDMIAGGQSPLPGWIPTGMFGFDSSLGINFDAAAAAKALDEAGFKDRSKLPKIKIGFNTNEDHQRIAENVQAQLKKNLGVDVELANEEWKVYLATLRTKPPSMFRLGWLADYPDPDNFMNLMSSGSENNHTGWKSTKYDEMLLKAVSMTDKEQRRKVYSEAQKFLTEQEVPVMPIYSGVSHVLMADRVAGLNPNPLERFIFKGVALKGERTP